MATVRLLVVRSGRKVSHSFESSSREAREAEFTNCESQSHENSKSRLNQIQIRQVKSLCVRQEALS